MDAPVPASTPSSNPTLPLAVADRLRDLITQGQLGPGARLNERELCQQLGVSRTPLREAFRLLAAEGLVRIEPNRGAQVVALSETDIVETFELIGALEAISGELACERASDREIAEIQALTYEMMASHARKDLPAYYRINHAIHERINLAANNRLLKQVYETQNLRIQNLRFGSNEDKQKWDQAMQEHLEMVDALLARDGPRLGRIMKSHMQRKADAALKIFSSGQLPQSN